MTTFVLVHGAWHGGWCWRRVRERLARLGHDVFTPTLTGLGERSHLLRPDIDLQTHVQDILAVLHWERLDDVVLCGHSYAGLVVTEVAQLAAGLVRSLVFLDAHVPEDGKSMADYVTPDRRRALEDGAAAGMDDPLEPLSAQWFGLNPTDRAWVDGFCTPQPRGTYATPVRITGAIAGIPKRTYIRATGYASEFFDASMARCAADPGYVIRRLACGHDAMIDDPDRLVALLIEAA